MQDILISFIIPAHNAEKYLSRAIESIICGECATNNVEVLVIENGSDDGTYNIAKEFADSKENVTVFESEKGVSNARNFGINKAKGKWICFVDADDYIKENTLIKLLDVAKDDSCDLFLFGHYSGKQERKIVDNDKVYDGGRVEAARIELLENPTRYMQVWGKLFKREVILNNNIRFSDELRLAEDSDFVIKYTKFCEKIMFCSESIYCYSIDNSSCMRTYDGTKVAEYLKSMNVSQQNMLNESVNINKAFFKYVLMHYNIAMVREVFNINNGMSFSEKKKNMKFISEKKIFKNAFDNVRLRECKSFRMLPIAFIKLHFYMFAGLIYITKAGINSYRERG